MKNQFDDRRIPESSKMHFLQRFQVPSVMVLLSLVLTPCLAWGKTYEVTITKFIFEKAILTDARGVVGNHHTYKFQGQWHLTTWKYETQYNYLKDHFDPFATKTHASGIYIGTAEWDRKTGEVKEKLTLVKGQDLTVAQKNFFGKRAVDGKCQKDPFLSNGLCLKWSHHWDIPSWDGKEGPIGRGLQKDGGGFVAGEEIDVMEAQQLSEMHKDDPSIAPTSSGPVEQGKTLKKSESAQSPGSIKPSETVLVVPPVVQSAKEQAPERSVVDPKEPVSTPRPMAGQSRRRSTLPNDSRLPNVPPDQPAGRSEPSQQMAARGPATMFTVEAEQLVQAGRASVNGGKVVVQPMAGFGQGWSGNAQLFWSGGAVGAVLDLSVDVPAAATYAMEVYMTRAPDYADFKLEVDGKPSPLTFSGYTQTVMAPNPMQAGNFSLQAGLRKISIMITGRYQQSTGYFVGIDQIKFYPAGSQ